MKSVDELRRETLLKAGWKEGSDLPKKLTTPSTVLRQENESLFFSGSDVIRQSKKSLSLKAIFDDPVFPLGTNHPKYIGHTWINIFDLLQQRDGKDMQRHLDNEMDMAKIVADLNKGSYDNICLYECSGCYAVETGNHRMAYLKVVYETLMANPDLSFAEKNSIRELQLNVDIKTLNYNIYPQIGSKHFSIPSFLPEMVEAEKKAIAAKNQLAISETVDTIVSQLTTENIDIVPKQNISAALSGDPVAAPAELKKYFDDMCARIRTLPARQEQVITTYYDENKKISSARSELATLEAQERTLSWTIQGLINSLQRHEDILRGMPNPKAPGNLITKQFDSKTKQAQRTAYANQWNACASVNQDISQKNLQLTTLRQSKAAQGRYINEHQQIVNRISEEFRVACDASNRALQTVDKIKKITSTAVANLADKIGVPNPYKYGVIITTYNR